VRVVFGVVFLIILLGCEKKAANDGGHIVGNGGDGLESTFQQGCTQAKRILQRLLGNGSGVMASAAKWGELVEYQSLQVSARDMLKHFDGLQLLWSKEPVAGCPVDKCGCTFPEQPGKVFLSYDNCRGHSIRQAGEVCFHEVSHFLPSVDEEKAKQLTTVAYDLWKRWQHPDVSHWAGVPHPPEMSGIGFQIAPEEFAFFSENRVSRYHIGFNQWGVNTLPAVDNLIVNYMEYPYFRSEPYAVPGGIFTYEYCHDQFPSGIGNQFDWKAMTWSVVPKNHAPSSRFRPVQVVTDAGLFVWGGELCTFHNDSGMGGWLRDGGIYRIGSGWDAVDGGPHWPTRNTLGAFTNEEVVLFGGSPTSEASAYNPKTKQWRTLGDPTHEIPSPRMNHTMTWNGEKLIVYGGCWPPLFNNMQCDPDGKVFYDGAIYDPKLDRWTHFESPGGPVTEYFLPLFAKSVAGKLAIFSGSNFFFLNPFDKKWTISESSVYGGRPFYWTGYEIVHLHPNHLQVYYP